MWRSSDGGRGREVTCIACGESLPRSKAREYDKYGDRWKRRDKEFEYLCKPCDRRRCHQPRASLESTLVEVETVAAESRRKFVDRYLELAAEPDESVEEQ